MDAKEWRDWHHLCTWLSLRPSNGGAYTRDLKGYAYLVGLSSAHRKELALVFYSGGWGWRLRKGWKERLETLRPEGAADPKPLRDCTVCNGTGKREEPETPHRPAMQFSCFRCHATGKEL